MNQQPPPESETSKAQDSKDQDSKDQDSKDPRVARRRSCNKSKLADSIRLAVALTIAR